MAVSGIQIAAPQDPLTLDPFFAKDPDVLKTYAFDYDAISSFQKDVVYSQVIVGGLPFSILCSLPCYFMCTVQNIEDAVRAQHLAITRDGIKYVVDRHDKDCRLECQQQGKVSKTVPYDKMTDCDVEEPAGSSGCCLNLVSNVLHVVRVDTASGDRTMGGHELTISGLVSPEEFKRDVWAMKRGEQIAGVSGTVAPLAVSMTRDHGQSETKLMSAGNPSVEAKLDMQTDLLREMLEVMKAQDALIEEKLGLQNKLLEQMLALQTRKFECLERIH
ncbi:hypothetical protein AB1Y20_018634 [Prymnesium parvum]|uniref:Phospholipid scramblase n=1 Tax=Prymnesium parvum TaxID=97485 RepID=A0AB34JSC6_PRYPA